MLNKKLITGKIQKRQDNSANIDYFDAGFFNADVFVRLNKAFYSMWPQQYSSTIITMIEA